jgi:methionyl-tRNA synthetase
MEGNMANEIETKEFTFETCPWCNSSYRDRQVLKVECDEGGPCRLYLQCDRCGVVYKVERVIFWRAERIASGESPGQEVAEFFEDWERRINEARRRVSKP